MWGQITLLKHSDPDQSRKFHFRLSTWSIETVWKARKSLHYKPFHFKSGYFPCPRPLLSRQKGWTIQIVDYDTKYRPLFQIADDFLPKYFRNSLFLMSWRSSIDLSDYGRPFLPRKIGIWMMGCPGGCSSRCHHLTTLNIHPSFNIHWKSLNILRLFCSEMRTWSFRVTLLLGHGSHEQEWY